MFGRVSAGRFSRMFSRPHSEGAGAVACAAALPLAVLALAVTADYAKVSHFRGRVQQATDAASVAAAEAVARQPDRKSTRLNSSHVSQSRMPSSA